MQRVIWAAGVLALCTACSSPPQGDSQANVSQSNAASISPSVAAEKKSDALTYHEEKICSMENAEAMWIVTIPANAGRPNDPTPFYFVDGHTIFVNVVQKGDARKMAFVVDGKEQPYYDGVIDPKFYNGKLAYRAFKGQKQLLVIDGKETAAYDEVQLPAISANEKHFAFAAKKGEKWIAVVDGKESEPYEYVAVRPSDYMPIENHRQVSNSGRYVFTALRDSDYVHVIDGKTKRPGNGAATFFGNNDEHLAFVTSDQRVVVDGVEGPLFDGIQYQTVKIIDEKHVMYLASISTAQYKHDDFVVYDGKRYTPVNATFLDWDEPNPAIAIKLGDKQAVLRHGEVGPKYDQVATVQTFGDSKHLAYAAKKGEAWVAVIDGKEFESHGNIVGELFEKKFIMSPADDHWAWKAKRDGKEFYVVDGKELPAEKSADSFLFSADGKQNVYIANDGTEDAPKMRIVANGKSSQIYSAVYIIGFAGDKVAALVQVPGKPHTYLIIGNEGTGFVGVDLLYNTIASDGKHFAFTARTNDGWQTIVDGVPGATFKNITDMQLLPGQPLICYFARDKALYRGEWK